MIHSIPVDGIPREFKTVYFFIKKNLLYLKQEEEAKLTPNANLIVLVSYDAEKAITCMHIIPCANHATTPRPVSGIWLGDRLADLTPKNPDILSIGSSENGVFLQISGTVCDSLPFPIA